MKKYHSLENEEDLPELYLYGLKTINIPNYLYIFELNNKLQTQFQRIEDFELFYQNQNLNFVQYYFFDNKSQTDLHIIQNLSLPTEKKSSSNELFETSSIQQYFLKKFKRFNFILKTNQVLTKEFLVHLSSDSNLVAIQDIDKEEVRKIQKFIA